MKMQISSSLFVAGCSAALLLGACAKQSVDDYVESLPDLPPEIAATLDPATLATRTVQAFPLPERAPGVALAPCCAISDKKTLTVNYLHTKCRSPADLIVKHIGFFRSSQQTDKLYKLRELGGKRFPGIYACVTSQGPWNASLEQTRACQNYTPRWDLTISAHDELVTFTWYGGIEGHPADVQLASCRQIGVIRYVCGTLSTCDCISSACPASDPCQCNLQW